MSKQKKLTIFFITLFVLTYIIFKDNTPHTTTQIKQKKTPNRVPAQKKRPTKTIPKVLSPRLAPKIKPPTPLEVKELIKTYEYMAQFPKTSNPINSTTRTKYERKFDIKQSLSSSIDTPSLQARSWSTQNYYFIPGKTPTIKIQVLYNGKLVKAKVVAKLYNNKNKLLKNITFKQNDALTYSKAFTNLNEGQYLIKYTASINKTQFIKSIESFNISKNNISYLGKTKDYLDKEGNLVIETLINSREAGSYILQSVCYDEINTPIALAEKFLKLKKGEQWIKYKLHGYIFTSLQKMGSFNIKHLSIGKVSDNLSISTGKPYSKNYWTHYYRSSEFNKNAFSNKEFLNKRDKLITYLKSR